MYLVTGGAGFIGSNVVAALSDRGESVCVCDRLRTGQKWRNLAKVPVHDLVKPETLPQWLEAHGKALEAVVHLGAISSTTEPDVDLIIDTNFRLSWFLWEWCARNAKRLLYASSAATYGSGAQGFDDDPALLPQLRPLNAYGWSKHLFDRRVASELDAGAAHPPQWAGFKFFNVYGPNEYHKGSMQSVVAQKYTAATEGQPVTLFRSYQPDYPDGGQKRDFVYVRDCVDVLLWFLDHPAMSGLYNLGSGQARSFAELAAVLLSAVGRPQRIEYVEMPSAIRPNYQYFTEANLKRLRDAGYTRPFTSLEEGVGEYVERYLSCTDRYR
jgi:ADP-L-glycero-D-manno-heptose 6-epimerase